MHTISTGATTKKTTQKKSGGKLIRRIKMLRRKIPT